MPGINDVAANVIAAEVGLDMGRFASASNLRSWARICPGLDESAGKHRSTRIPKGASWLKTTLVSAAWAAVKTKGSYFQAQFQRLRAQRGPKKAIIAVAASMLTAAYYILRDGVPYKELGSGVRSAIVLGSAGSGKTTWMRWTFRRLIECDEPAVVPFFLELRTIARLWKGTPLDEQTILRAPEWPSRSSLPDAAALIVGRRAAEGCLPGDSANRGP